MKVLVTGATGFIGSRLVELLAERGHAVIAASRSAEARSWPTGVQAKRLDITDPGSFGGAFDRVDAVVHAAALVGDWGPREDFFRHCEDGTRHVVQAARAAGVPVFVHVSSVAVYGLAKSGPIPEDTARVPSTDRIAYNAAKSAAEGVIEDARAEGYPATIVRPANVYGPRAPNWTERPVALIRKGLMGLPRGAGPSNTVYVDNVAALLITTVEDERARGETFHVVDSERQDWNAFFGQYATALGKRVPVRPLWFLRALATVLETLSRITGRAPLVSHDALAFVLSQGWYPMEKCQRVLGFTPPVPASEGMTRTLAWITPTSTTSPTDSTPTRS